MVDGLSPQGRSVRITGGGYTATIYEVGANLSSLTAPDGRDLILSVSESQIREGSRGALLAPWPNRLEDGSYTFEGETYQVPVNEIDRNNANHGLVDWQRWALSAEGDQPSSVCASLDLLPTPGYPFRLSFEAIYSVDKNGLSVSVSATNRGAENAPYALGSHPYLVADGNTAEGSVDEWTLCAPVRTFLEVNDRMLPIAEKPVEELRLDVREEIPLKDLELDHAFGGIEFDETGSACVRVLSDSGKGAGISFDRDIRWVQMYSDGASRRALAVEPMTAPANAFISGTDLTVLAPGDTKTVSWRVYSIESR